MRAFIFFWGIIKIVSFVINLLKSDRKYDKVGIIFNYLSL